MKMIAPAFALALGAALAPASLSAQQVPLGDRTVPLAARDLKAGQYIWTDQANAAGPALVIVNLATQRLVLFRNGVPVAASTVSSGKTGHETPTGVFSILQKNKDHHSKTYNNAPMPNMQRLTWQGIALHAGNLPGYPASHGCVRLPLKFSDLLFGATTMGMTVVITSLPAVPHDSGDPTVTNVAAGEAQTSFANAYYEWHPEGPVGPDDLVSVVVSAADRRATVFRGGKRIGSAPVRVSGDLGGGTAYVLKSWDSSGKHWLKLQFSGAGGSMEVGSDEASRFDTPAAFRAAVGAALRPGSVIIVTPESLKAGSAGKGQTVLETDEASR